MRVKRPNGHAWLRETADAYLLTRILVAKSRARVYAHDVNVHGTRYR